MAFQLVLGGSGRGKSTWLYQWLIDQSIQHPEGDYIVMVPEQFTMQTQRQLCMMHPSGGIWNIDILSFKRLALRVFEETGITPGEVLTETGKNLILKKVAGQVKDRLQVMGGRLDKPGYISEIKSALSEFAQYEIGDEELEEMIEKAAGKQQLQGKLQDLKVLREAFDEFRADRFISGEELLDVFAQAAPLSRRLKNATLVFDGFTGFTPVQMTALRAIFPLVKEIKITVTLGSEEKLAGRIIPHELFAMSKKTIKGLHVLASETGVEILDPVYPNHTGRFIPGSGLDNLERTLMRTGRAQQGDAPKDIFLQQLPDPAVEAENAARLIRRLTGEEGLRMREIAVIAGDLPSYEKIIEHTFAGEEIPFFIDRTKSIFLNPALEFIRGGLAVAQESFSYESLMRFLRTGCTGLEVRSIDLLDNYVLACGIRGRKRWQSDWTIVPRGYTEEMVSEINDTRKVLMERLDPFMDAFLRKQASASEYTEALYDMMVGFDLPGVLSKLELEAQEAGRKDKALEFGQIYGVIIHLLDEIVQLLGEEVLTLREFSQILEAGFSEAKVGIVPPGLDQVHVGDMERTRLNGIKVLIFVGVNDGWIPKKSSSAGIMSDFEREFLEEAGIALAPGERENSFIQRFYLYLCLTKPSMRLYLTCAGTAMDGKSLRPSYLMNLLRGKSGVEELTAAQEEELPEKIRSLQEGPAVLAAAIRQIADGERQVDDKLLESIRSYLSLPEYAPTVRTLLKAGLNRTQPARLTPDMAQKLYGLVLSDSVTRLERFAACPFSHFAQYGLSLRERPVFSVSGADLGNLAHYALELFARKTQENALDWKAITPQMQAQLSDECVQEVLEDYGFGLFKDTARNRYLASCMERIVRRSLWASLEQIKAGSFVPTAFEVPFQAAGNLPGTVLDLGGGRRMTLKGRIDRVDIAQSDDRRLVKVIDYKSGKTGFDPTSLYNGEQLQLPVYLRLAMEMEKKANPGSRIIPAGLLYYHLQDPMIKGTLDSTFEDLAPEILKAFKPDGYVNSSEEVLHAFDNSDSAKSPYVAADRLKSGGLAKVAKALPTNTLQDILSFTEHKLTDLGRAIESGSIEASPWKKAKKTACDYCNYRNVCRFDPAAGSSYRSIRKMKPEEAFEAIVREEAARKKQTGGEADGE